MIDERGGARSESTLLASTRGVLEPLPPPAQHAITFALLVSAIRCTVQYVVLPFALPWIGITAAIPAWATLILGGVALASLARNVRSLWRARHSRRWSYLFLALVIAAALLLFIVVDARALVL